jgi:hypothetical protein
MVRGVPEGIELELLGWASAISSLASSFETHRFALHLWMTSQTFMVRSQTLMVRSRALRGVSNHEASGKKP